MGLRINQLNTAMVLINLAKQLHLLYEFLRLVSAKCSPTNSFWGSCVEISLLEGASLGVKTSTAILISHLPVGLFLLIYEGQNLG